jgi:hypothetical protein
MVTGFILQKFDDGLKVHVHIYVGLRKVDSQLFESEELDASLCSHVILCLILLVLIYPDSEETLLGGFSMVEILYYLLQVVYFYEIYFWDLCLL